ncbi:MAG: aminotransferase class III-fold pyridoxal phosphate-dependent enzyme [Pseudomonadota bacterium]
MSGPKDEALKRRAEKVIPNGMYGHQTVRNLPEGYPQFFVRAEGARLWDADGREFVDFMCAYGPNLFGYRNETIDAAYVAQLSEIDAATGPSPLIVDLAEAFVQQIGHADWAMFCKNGTDATSMALMTARAHAGKRKIVFAKGAYHGSAPWGTPAPAGTVEDDRAHFMYCAYNDARSLEAACAEAGDDLAGVFAAPFKHDVLVAQEAPDPAYARRARELCDAKDALLVVDDIRAGFRMSRDCSWAELGVAPDLSCWGKAIANGHPISALVGSDRARTAAGEIFATGSFWFQAAPMAASLATLKLIKETDYLERAIALGERLRAGLAEAASRRGVRLEQTGPPQTPLIMVCDEKGDLDPKAGYAFGTELAARGVYFHPWHNMFISAAMTEADIDHAVSAADDAMAAIRETAAAG